MKSAKSEQNLIFFTENGLKCIIGTPRNPFLKVKNWQKKKKIGKNRIRLVSIT